MDPQQQQHVAAMAASLGVAFLIFGLLVSVFLVFLVWRIFVKAGMAGPLSLLILIPGLGLLVVLCILAFSDWNVAPLPSAYSAGLPPYPPQAYPPQNYPPVGPPAL